jgi:HAD superfamily hydrolase (TIGR01549 family)
MSDQRTALFDLGGTLIFFDGDWPDVYLRADQALIDALDAAGIRLNREAFREDFRARLKAYYNERESEFIEYTTGFVLKEALANWGYLGVPDSTIRPALDAMYKISQAHWLAESDALPALTELLQRGFRLGLISNAGDDADVQALVDKVQLRPFFELILTSASLGIRKPNPRIFQIAIQRLGADPDLTVMVGDTLGADILGARNAGIRSIWITRRADTPANRAHADTITPDAAARTLEEVPDLAERLLPGGSQPSLETVESDVS